MKNSTGKSLSLLDNKLICDILSDEDSVLEILMNKKKEAVLKKHPYAITPPKSEGGSWQTSYRDEQNKRHCVKATTKEALIEKLYEIYSADSYIENLTFHKLFLEWYEFKKTISNSDNTIMRYLQIYNKYFANSRLHSRKLKDISELDLELECNRIIKENNLTRKAWTNAKTILNGMYKHAVRKGYLVTNPLQNMTISVKYKQTCKKTGRTETYNSEEYDLLMKYLDKKLEEKFDPAIIAVKVNFLLGLRVGELVSLKWSDIEGNKIHIVREEIRNQSTNKYDVVEHTKTRTDRYVYLVPKALELFSKLPKIDDYIFIRDSERLHSRQIAYVLEKYAKDNDLITKSTHKMRKTYASKLNANGVPLDAIRELLGHSELSTTLGYIYNPLTESETFDLIARSLY